MTDRADSIATILAKARRSQGRWAASPLAARLHVVRRARHLFAEAGLRLAEASAACRQRPAAEALTAEVLPLAAACRFLEREAARLLRPRRPGLWSRPLWLGGIGSEVRREPFGVVLVIGPGNYPLFLAGVQALQALAAGNAVLLKPAPGSATPVRLFVDLLHQAGLDPDLAQVLPDTTEAAQAALGAGVDKVVFTGSADTGARILAQIAPRLTPSTMELSGCDAVFVRADADLDLVTRSVSFGLQLNGGATCIGPRRLFVPRSLATELEGRLARALGASSSFALRGPAADRVRPLVEEALAGGAHLVAGSLAPDGALQLPLVLAGVPRGSALLREDVFASVLSVVAVDGDDEALALAAESPYALGATVFGRDEAAARALAGRVRAGGVVVNDMVAPTADPRLPFGGRGRSGFGVTRGAEGLLEMTTPKVIQWNRARWRPHLDPAAMGDADLFAAFLQFLHGPGRGRGAALRRLMTLGRRRMTSPKDTA
jgi:acyl-CoA reductase-like NAD-dependent aldehyde dehydrogenase